MLCSTVHSNVCNATVERQIPHDFEHFGHFEVLSGTIIYETDHNFVRLREMALDNQENLEDTYREQSIH